MPLTVWRLEEDHQSWSKQYEMVLKKTWTSSSSSLCKYDLENCSVVDLHPEKPEIVFLVHLDDDSHVDTVLSCNLRMGTGELEFFFRTKLLYT
ncbi:unnamed protein product [Linum trigynum]|uniref:F-box associated domain-containing protein n=1 Tax=Linum trigynum TaxID=586398 RepID=A0AAV2EZM9_9ROSI